MNSDKIRFSSTYKNISSVEQLYFSISKNAKMQILYSFPEKAKNFVMSEISLARPTFIVFENTFTEKRTLLQHSVTKSALHQHIEFAMSLRLTNSAKFR